MDCNSQTMTNIDINSGASDGTTIGTNNQSSIRGTTITADQGISTKNGTGEPGFIEFYSTNDTNNIKVVAPTVTTNSTLTLPDTGDGDLISTADTETVSTQMLSTSGVTSGTYGTTSSIPEIQVDNKGRITSVQELDIATTLTVAGDTGSNNDVELLNDTLTLTGGTGISTTVGTDEVTFSLDNTRCFGQYLWFGYSYS